MVTRTTATAIISAIVATVIAATTVSALPPDGYNKVAYYTFDATPVRQDCMSLLNFTDNANIVVVFEGTLWELADSVHYDSQWMSNKIYRSKKHILDDIKTLQERGWFVLMNVDDAASWSTETPFTTWDGKQYNYKEFASFVDSCVNVVGFDGITLDVEHKAVDNVQYRNLIKEFGKYFGPLSANPATKLYTAAVYDSRYGVPGEIFREEELSRYCNFIMDMGYAHDNQQRFDFWADHLGAEKVMLGMSHEDNDLDDALEWMRRYPAPETAGIMVYAANVNKTYTDSLFATLGDPPVTHATIVDKKQEDALRIERRASSIAIYFTLNSDARVALKLLSVNGRVHLRTAGTLLSRGRHCIAISTDDHGTAAVPSGIHVAAIEKNGTVAHSGLLTTVH